MADTQVFDVPALILWAAKLFTKAGLAEDRAETVASVLVEGDLLGHDTHGLALLAPYLSELQKGGLSATGEVEIISQRPAVELWDGHHLPGPWLVQRAIDSATARARDFGTSMITIKRSGHIACLASYLEKPARAGLMVELLCSDPSVCSVAPFGGTTAVFTPNPMAFGIPTGNEPILIDISTSITTNGMSNRLLAAGERFQARWLMDAQGNPSDDPGVFNTEPPGTIQLLGGMDSGHKGYGLTLLVEALTGGLAGYGRADNVAKWGATVTVRISDCEAFGGIDAFASQMDWLTQACHESTPIDPRRPVRIPGERGLARKRQALEQGLVLNPLVQASIKNLADQYSSKLPDS